jgi:hypothetical protein
VVCLLASHQTDSTQNYGRAGFHQHLDEPLCNGSANENWEARINQHALGPGAILTEVYKLSFSLFIVSVYVF